MRFLTSVKVETLSNRLIEIAILFPLVSLGGSSPYG